MNNVFRLSAISALLMAAPAAALPPPPASAPNVSPAPTANSSGSKGVKPTAVQPSGPPGLSENDSCNAPIDITADSSEVFQPQRLVIYRGNVEATHCTARLRTPELRIFYKPRSPDKAAAHEQADAGTLGANTGGLDHMEAAGPVYYITPTENARADHMLYEADPDTITMTGNVVLVNGKNVGTGEKFVMNRKTGQDQLYASAATHRVRTILYTQKQEGQPAAR